jgi:replicative DNA helicase
MAAMHKLYSNDMAIDPLTLGEELPGVETGYLYHLMDNIVTTVNIKDHIKKLKGRNRKKLLLESTIDFHELVEQGKEQEAISKMLTVFEEVDHEDDIKPMSVVWEILENELAKRDKGTHDMGISTGFSSINSAST